MPRPTRWRLAQLLTPSAILAPAHSAAMAAERAMAQRRPAYHAKAEAEVGGGDGIPWAPQEPAGRHSPAASRDL